MCEGRSNCVSARKKGWSVVKSVFDRTACRTRRRRVLSVLALGVAVSILATVPAFGAGDANTSSCPASTESSSGFRASLPDCRAYEVVNQANSSDTAIVIPEYGFAEGEHFLYSTVLPVPGAEEANGLKGSFLATRTAAGWEQRALSVPQGEGQRTISLGVQSDATGVMLTGGFADALLMSPYQDPFEAPRLDESTGTMVYDLSLEPDGGVSTVSLPDSGKLTQSMVEYPSIYGEDDIAFATGWGMFLVGASENGNRVFFVTSAKLDTAPGTPVDTHKASSEIYERTGDHTYLVGVLPDGEVPVCGAEVGQSDKDTTGALRYDYGAVAADGSNVVFRAPGHNAFGAPCTESESGVFLRNVVENTTVKLDGELYVGRTGIGGAEEKILTAAAGKIFEYDIATKQTVEVVSESTGILAYSADGSRFYYLGPEEGIYLHEEGASSPKLLPGTLHSRYGGNGIKEEPGRLNDPFYGGMIETGEESSAGRASANAPVTTPNGKYLMFVNPEPLTDYQTCTGSTGNEQCHYEAYIYSVATGAVTCISCDPQVAPLNGDAGFIAKTFHEEAESSFVPTTPPLIYSSPGEDGKEAVMRAVFETTEGLVPQDTNGAMDVYEWEQEDTEGCSVGSLKLANLKESSAYSEVDHGCLYLLTSGVGEEVPTTFGSTDGTHLVGASEGLKDIYVQTPEQLLPGLDNAEHIYDIRTDGGFQYTQESKGCEPGLCRTESSTPPSVETPASIGFNGAGNLTPSSTVTSKTVTPKKRTAGQVRTEKLKKALKVCRAKPKGKRRACEATARKRYAVKSKRAIKSIRGGK